MKNRNYYHRYKYELSLIILSLAVFILHIHLASTLNLGNDEAHYFVWSLKPSIGYLDDAPLVAYIIGFFVHIVGKTELAVRLGAVIVSFLDGFLVYYLTLILFKSKRASFFAFLFFLSAIIFGMVLSVMMLPDALLLFFYLCFLIFFYKAIEFSNKSKKTPDKKKKVSDLFSLRKKISETFFNNSLSLWILTGISLGLAFLSKYTAALIPPVILLYLLVSEKNRMVLKTAYPYIALFIALIIFSPVIYWNALHNFISFKFQLSHGFSSPKPGIILFIQGFMGQFFVVTPLIYLFLIFSFFYSVVLLIKNYNSKDGAGIINFKYNTKTNEAILYSFMMSFPILLFFIINGYSHRILVHWPDIGYLSAFSLMGFVADGFISGHNQAGYKFWNIMKSAFVKYYIYLAIFTGLFLSFVLYNQIYYNSIPVGKIIKYIDKQKKLKTGGIFGLIPHIPGKANTADITDDLFGWNHGAKYIGIVYRGYKIAYPDLFILTHHYAVADELVFYGNYKPAGNIYNISGFLNQYDLWQNLYKINGKDALFVMDGKYMINPYKAYGKFFKSIKKIGSLDIYVKFRPVRVYYLYLMKDFMAYAAISHIKTRMY